MQVDQLNDMTRGWFVGDFNPAVLNTKAFEVGVKHYKAGDSEQKHVHKVATEITVVVSGTVKMNDQLFSDGDIITLKPGEACKFEAMTDAINVVVKTPSVMGDKYIVED